jgi:hypothetical protein
MLTTFQERTLTPLRSSRSKRAGRGSQRAEDRHTTDTPMCSGLCASRCKCKRNCPTRFFDLAGPNSDMSQFRSLPAKSKSTTPAAFPSPFPLRREERRRPAPPGLASRGKRASRGQNQHCHGFFDTQTNHRFGLKRGRCACILEL